MKKFLAALVLASTLTTMTGCRSSTSYGECVGIDSADRDPKLVYRMSVRNVILGGFFVATVFAPAMVLFGELYCPVGVK